MDCIWLIVWLMVTLLLSAVSYEYVSKSNDMNKKASLVMIVVSLIVLIIVGATEGGEKGVMETFKIKKTPKEKTQKEKEDDARRAKEAQEKILAEMRKKVEDQKRAVELAKTNMIGKK